MLPQPVTKSKLTSRNTQVLRFQRRISRKLSGNAESLGGNATISLRVRTQSNLSVHGIKRLPLSVHLNFTVLSFLKGIFPRNISHKLKLPPLIATLFQSFMHCEDFFRFLINCCNSYSAILFDSIIKQISCQRIDQQTFDHIADSPSTIV